MDSREGCLTAKEEKRSEAFFCACVTAYSAWFNSRTAGQLLLQFLSAFLSMYMFAGYVVQSVDMALPTQPEGTHADVANDLVQVVGHPTLAQEVDETSVCVIRSQRHQAPQARPKRPRGPRKWQRLRPQTQHWRRTLQHAEPSNNNVCVVSCDDFCFSGNVCVPGTIPSERCSA